MPRKIRYEYIAQLIDHAAQDYPRGRTYPGEVTLFRAMTQPAGVKSDPTLGWGQLVTGVIKVVEVTGTHNSIMMHEQHVAELVHKIDEQLNQIQRSLPPQNSSTNHFSKTDSAILSLN